jgi:glycosylphosphatidylinositol transamidase (GPIT) subunit GPI8
MMNLDFLEFTPTVTLRLGAAVGITLLLVLLVASFVSRARVFCEYLRHMTGIELKPATVKQVYRAKGRGGVRDMLISLLIQQDLADPSRVVTPDSRPDTSIYDSKIFD